MGNRDHQETSRLLSLSRKGQHTGFQRKIVNFLTFGPETLYYEGTQEYLKHAVINLRVYIFLKAELAQYTVVYSSFYV